MHFLLTRPYEDSDRLAHDLRELGVKSHCDPLLTIKYLNSPEIDLANFQAILFTSGNGVRAFIRNSSDRDIACYTVGQATAQAAAQAGFQKISIAQGNVDELARLIIRDLDPKVGDLLHISGTDVAGNLSGHLQGADFQVSHEKLYQAQKSTQLSNETIALITSGHITHIPFYSPRTAQAFCDLCRKAGIDGLLSKITVLCLSSAVSNMINCLSWHQILIAPQPDQASLLNLVNITLKEDRS